MYIGAFDKEKRAGGIFPAVLLDPQVVHDYALPAVNVNAVMVIV